MEQFTTFDQVATLPQVSWDERKTLPDAPGLYFALSPDDRIIYVGKAGQSLRRRWRQHSHARQIRTAGSIQIAYVLIDGAELLDRVERAAIQAFRPMFNTRHVPEGFERKEKRWPFRRLE